MEPKNWETAADYQKIPEELLELYKDRINLNVASPRQRMSFEVFIKNIDRIEIRNLLGTRITKEEVSILS